MSQMIFLLKVRYNYFLSSNTVEKNRPDLSYIKITLQKIKKYLQKDQLFILESHHIPEQLRKKF